MPTPPLGASVMPGVPGAAPPLPGQVACAGLHCSLPLQAAQQGGARHYGRRR